MKKFFVFFVWVFSSHSRIFHSYGDVTINGEGLQSLTYARHSWPLSCGCSLACYTHGDTALTLQNGHLRGLVTLTIIAERLAVELSLPVLSQLGFEHPTFRLRGLGFNLLPYRHG